MRIAFVYDAVYPWVTGGVERRIYEIGTRLAKRGHDVHIFSLGYWMDSDEYKNQDTIKYDKMTLHSVGKAMELYNNDIRSIKEVLYFSRRLLKFDFSEFDIVDCQGFPYFSCYSTKIKTLNNDTNLVITVHEIWNDYWYEYLGKKGFFGKIIEKGMLHLTDNIISVSELTKNNMLKNHQPKNTTVIANGVDTNKIISINPSEDYCDIIFAGRLIPEKHVDLLIHAIKEVVTVYPYIKCKIIGDGPLRKKLELVVKELELENNIIFEGFYKNQEELYSKIKSSRLMVLPSKREGFGIILIEANACGIPVITLNNPMNAAKDLISEDTGWLTEDNSNFLAKTITNILDEGISVDMRIYCRKFAKKFDWNHITSLTEDYYDSIIAKK